MSAPREGDGAWTWDWRTRSAIGPTCSTCQTIHGSSEVVAVGRFDPAGARGYRVRSGGPIRATRAEAHTDLCATRLGAGGAA